MDSQDSLNTQLPCLVSLTPEEITAGLELKPFQGKQIFRWLHEKRVFDVEKMSDLSKVLRERITQGWRTHQLSILREIESPDSGTRRVLFQCTDGETLESVRITHENRVTLCLSTQVGCPVNCAFCATGRSGYRRNLSADEIIEQALHLLANEELGERTPNLVYMGMGEPFLNYDNVIRSLRILMRPEGVGVGARKITVSTAGHVPGIRRFMGEEWQVRLSVSLHAANNALRDRLVPMNRKFPIEELVRALRTYSQTTGRHFTFEWTLLAGVNDTTKDANELAALMEGLPASVNLIAYNAVPGAEFKAPQHRVCEAFRDLLARKGVQVTLRRERGQDIEAACGQLRIRTAEELAGDSAPAIISPEEEDA